MATHVCTGCDRPVWEAHTTIAEHLACEAAQQAAVREALDAADAAERAARRRQRAVARWGTLLRREER